MSKPSAQQEAAQAQRDRAALYGLGSGAPSGMGLRLGGGYGLAGMGGSPVDGRSDSLYPEPQVIGSGRTSEGLAYEDWSSGARTQAVRQANIEATALAPLSNEGSGSRYGPPSGAELAGRFGQGLLGAVKSVTVEPLLQVRDLGLAVASVSYNELFRSNGDAMWLPEMKSGMADAYANGASQTRLLMQSNFVTGTGVLTHDLTTSAMNSDWGSVAEQLGGVAGGLAIGKGTSKYGGYGLALEDIGATGPFASQRGAVKISLVTPNSVGEGFGANSGVDSYVAGLQTKVTPTSSNAGLFEVQQTGPLNYRVTGGGTAIDADGYKGTTLLDAKYVGDPRISPYVDNSNVPSFLRDKILTQQQYEFQRYQAVIADPTVPFNSLNILTNEPAATPYFQRLMDQYQIPGEVKVVPTNIPQIGPKKP